MLYAPCWYNSFSESGAGNFDIEMRHKQVSSSCVEEPSVWSDFEFSRLASMSPHGLRPAWCSCCGRGSRGATVRSTSGYMTRHGVVYWA